MHSDLFLTATLRNGIGKQASGKTTGVFSHYRRKKPSSRLHPRPETGAKYAVGRTNGFDLRSAGGGPALANVFTGSKLLLCWLR